MNGLDSIYLTENNVSINGHESSLVSVLYGVLQGSVLGPLVFNTHHFADDTNLLHFNKSVCSGTM